MVSGTDVMIGESVFEFGGASRFRQCDSKCLPAQLHAEASEP
jgi:hypothetical protein